MNKFSDLRATKSCQKLYKKFRDLLGENDAI